MDDRLANWLSTYQQDQKGLVMIKHPVTKGRATELYKNNFFPHFQEPGLLVCVFKIFDVIVLFQCFTVTLTKV